MFILYVDCVFSRKIIVPRGLTTLGLRIFLWPLLDLNQLGDFIVYKTQFSDIRVYQKIEMKFRNSKSLCPPENLGVSWVIIFEGHNNIAATFRLNSTFLWNFTN